MNGFDEVVLNVFLEKQGQLFPEPVAETAEEAAYFLEDVMAVVVNSRKEVVRYFEESGADFDPSEIQEAAEVFAIGDGRYLIVEG
ncbi:MAG: glyoxalase [Eubacterium sp.]|nr:glyoxalase [Eubacterium sp.]